MKRKVCVITGSRAEYGLLNPLMEEIRKDNAFILQIIATGMHLSPEFGLTYREIENDGFSIDKKIDIHLSSDTPVGIAGSMALAQTGFAEAFEELRPDIAVVLGDRFEIFAAASAALVSRVPIAHLNGGERTEGAVDEAMRHSITKMSHLHFTGAEEYRKRVIQLGEQPERVFNTGSTGLDNIKKLKLLTKNELEKSLGFTLGEKNFLATFHPVTLENRTSGDQFRELLNALSELKTTKIIFTKPNADTDGRIIMKMIDEYVGENPGRTAAFDSLGRLRYLSALQYMDAVVGNSYSGLIEAPSFKIGTINIGDRQKGRIKAESVIDCTPDKASILTAFKKLYSEEFRAVLKTVQNPFGDGGASARIKEIIKNFDLTGILKKEFYDIDF
jgi:GDP/UDP-N,N'-diacetylbacillosamine 2-epimerase (hydrolysing)